MQDKTTTTASKEAHCGQTSLCGTMHAFERTPKLHWRKNGQRPKGYKDGICFGIHLFGTDLSIIIVLPSTQHDFPTFEAKNIGKSWVQNKNSCIDWTSSSCSAIMMHLLQILWAYGCSSLGEGQCALIGSVTTSSRAVGKLDITRRHRRSRSHPTVFNIECQGRDYSTLAFRSSLLASIFFELHCRYVMIG